MLGTPPQDKLHKHLHIPNACERSWIMMIMVGSKMYKTEYDLKVIIYPAYDKPHKLCNIRGNWNIQQPRLPPNNAGRPMRQFKCPLTWRRAGSPPVRFLFSREGGIQCEGCTDPDTGISPCANRMGKHNEPVCSGEDQWKPQSPRVTGLCEGNSTVTGEFTAQSGSNAEMFPLMTSSCVIIR